MLHRVSLRPVTELEISNVIDNLKKNAAPGHDGICVNNLLLFKKKLLPVLVKLINTAFQTGIYPDVLKISRVIPIFKAGEHNKIHNYRPISLISNISKIFEIIIKNRLVEFVSKYVGRDPYQYGFVENSGTLCATTDFVNYISSELDKGNFVVAIYIDLQKAFDVVDHSVLLDKLEKMGVRGVALSLLKTYLSNRRQYVTLNSADSAMLFNAAGVPQGSVLGPLLYTLHVLSLKNIKLSCKYFSFADDTVLVFVISLRTYSRTP